MVRLWFLSADGDIVRYEYQVEEESMKGKVAYSRSQNGVKFLDSVAESTFQMYRSGVRMALFKMAKNHDFQDYYDVAIY